MSSCTAHHQNTLILQSTASTKQMAGDSAHIQLRRPKCVLLLSVPYEQYLGPSRGHVHNIIGMPIVKTGPRTGSYSGLYVFDPCGRHVFHDRRN